MIFGFDQPHAVGSVCRFPCSQCNDDPNFPNASMICDAHEEIPSVPLYIVREATYAEYLDWCVESEATLVPNRPDEEFYYYEVQTD